MRIVTRLLVPIILVVAALAAGCGGATATPLTAQEIAGNAVSAYQSVKTVKIGMDMVMALNMEGAQQPMKIDMKASATGSLDVTNTRMNMLMNVDMTMPVVGNQKTSTDMYIVDNWLYMKVFVPVVGDQWMRMKLSPEMWQQQNQLDRQIQVLKTAIKVTSLGEETVDGTLCYVLSVTPDMAALAGFLASEMQQGSTTDFLENADLSRLFKSVVIKEWVSKQDYLPMKLDMRMGLEMLPEDVGAKSTDFTRMAMEMSIVGKYYDYNKPLDITLPAAAAGAKEAPSTR